MKKFHVIVIDAGWPTVAHKVMHGSLKAFESVVARNHSLMVFSEKQSQEIMAKYPEDLGTDPTIIITHLDPKKIKKFRPGAHLKELDGVRINLGELASEEAILGCLLEVCQLINDPKFTSDVPWKEREKMFNFVVTSGMGKLFYKALAFII